MDTAWKREWIRTRLDRGAVKSLLATRDHDVRLACHAGRLWVTREGDREDYLLEAGESDIFRGAGRVVVEALAEDSRVSLWVRRSRGRRVVAMENLREVVRDLWGTRMPRRG